MEALSGSSNTQSKNEFEKLLRTTPDAAAEIILKGVRRKSRRVLVGTDARFIDLFQRLFPAGYQRFIVMVMRARAAKGRKAMAGNRAS